MPLWPGFVYRDPVPRMGRYDPVAKGWFSTGLSDVEIDIDAQVLKFKTEHLGAVTLIQVTPRSVGPYASASTIIGKVADRLAPSPFSASR